MISFLNVARPNFVESIVFYSSQKVINWEKKGKNVQDPKKKKKKRENTTEKNNVRKWLQEVISPGKMGGTLVLKNGLLEGDQIEMLQ